MKKLIFTLLTTCTGYATPGAAQENLPSMVIGGIEVRGIAANADILHSIVYKSSSIRRNTRSAASGKYNVVS